MRIAGRNGITVYICAIVLYCFSGTVTNADTIYFNGQNDTTSNAIAGSVTYPTNQSPTISTVYPAPGVPQTVYTYTASNITYKTGGVVTSLSQADTIQVFSPVPSLGLGTDISATTSGGSSYFNVHLSALNFPTSAAAISSVGFTGGYGAYGSNLPSLSMFTVQPPLFTPQQKALAGEIAGATSIGADAVAFEQLIISIVEENNLGALATVLESFFANAAITDAADGEAFFAVCEADIGAETAVPGTVLCGLAATAVALDFVGIVAETIQTDPPDPNYQVMFVPTIEALPTGLAGLCTDLGATSQALPVVLDDVQEWENALYVTNNRFQTAIGEGDLNSANLQSTTFQNYLGSYNGSVQLANKYLGCYSSLLQAANLNIPTNSVTAYFGEVTGSLAVNSVGNLTLVAAVLPLSRSVEVGGTATAFATMINAGPDDATGCTIAPQTGIPARFVFQTTDPATNALTGAANSAVNIPAGQAQSFVIALSPTAAFAPTDVPFFFTCANAPIPAVSTIGLDTLNLSGSTSPVPDVVALAASGDPGYVDIPGATGTGVFAVATVNLGIDATITATANTGAANLPVTLTICQTNPTTGICLAAPASSVTTDIQPNATPTFGIFVAGSASVADSPGINRVFVTFTDAGGVLRGETSVAVRTH